MFQVGGSFGSSMGPVLAALDRGAVRPAQHRLVLLDRLSARSSILWRIGQWYKPQIAAQEDAPPVAAASGRAESRAAVMIALAVLVALLFSKQLYVSSLSSYYIFYLIDQFGVSTQAAQLYLFIFLAANAVGAFFGGPLGDRFGRKYVIWFSILGALPFTLALPYVGLAASAVLTVIIGLIISSATSSIIVFAQELVPHRFGMISGVFFGVAFGIGGLGAAVLGKLADHTGIELRLPDLCVPAGDRIARSVPAEDAEDGALTRTRCVDTIEILRSTHCLRLWRCRRCRAPISSCRNTSRVSNSSTPA